MNKHEFLSRFQYQSLANKQQGYQHQYKLTPAAVLIPIIDHGNHLSILLTKRASHLKHHAGQVSFPGGKREAHDTSDIATALREANEEIGLNPQDVNVIGSLSNYQTISGYNIKPILGIINNNLAINADKNEVSEVFTIPFNHIMTKKNFISIAVQRQRATYDINFIPYQHYNIWGATAAILLELKNHLSIR